MISLTLKSGGAFKILKDNVYRFATSASGSGSTVFYFTPFSSEEKQIEVEESTTDINTDAGTFFVEATTVSGVQYLNPFYIVLVSQNGSGADIVFGKEQNKPIQLTVTESVSTISTAIDNGTAGGTSYSYITEDSTSSQRSLVINVNSDDSSIKNFVRTRELNLQLLSQANGNSANNKCELYMESNNLANPGDVTTAYFTALDGKLYYEAYYEKGIAPYVRIGAASTTEGEGTVKIQSVSSGKLSFFDVNGVLKQTTAVTGATVVGGGGTALTDTDTFDGYTLAQVVAALRNYGLLA